MIGNVKIIFLVPKWSPTSINPGILSIKITTHRRIMVQVNNVFNIARAGDILVVPRGAQYSFGKPSPVFWILINPLSKFAGVTVQKIEQRTQSSLPGWLLMCQFHRWVAFILTLVITIVWTTSLMISNVVFRLIRTEKWRSPPTWCNSCTVFRFVFVILLFLWFVLLFMIDSWPPHPRICCIWYFNCIL